MTRGRLSGVIILGKKKLPKIKATYSIWRKRDKDNHLQIDEVQLISQCNFHMKNKMSKDELYQIELEVKRIIDDNIIEENPSKVINSNSAPQVMEFDETSNMPDKATY